MPDTRYQIAVTKFIEVTIPEGIADDAFLEKFSQYMHHVDSEVDIAEHIAFNNVQGQDEFVEGIGKLEELGITSIEVDSSVEAQTIYKVPR